MNNMLVSRLLSAGYLKHNESGNPLIIILRSLSVPFISVALYLKIQPNVVTTISILLGCGAAMFYWLGLLELFLIAWTISVILDYADGTVARKSGQESHFGYLYDMFGDRLKLVSLIMAWWLVDGSTLATIIVIITISLLVSLEIVTHLFVKTSLENSNEKIKGHGMFYQVFLYFNMHSFFLYGAILYIGGSTDFVANVWLIFIIFLVLKNEVHNRFFCDGLLRVRVNNNITSKIIAFLTGISKKVGL